MISIPFHKVIMIDANVSPHSVKMLADTTTLQEQDEAVPLNLYWLSAETPSLICI